MKSSLPVGAVAAPKTQFPDRSSKPQRSKTRRIASLSAAAAMVVGVGAGSAIFVDYLADRALARAADTPAPLVVKTTVVDAAEVIAKATPIAPEPSAPVKPAEIRIAAAVPDAAAIAKVAIGSEHAVELPADDPTAIPILQLDHVAAQSHALLVDEIVPIEEPITADVEDDATSDETRTAAIAPDAAGPVLDEQPVKKPKRQRAEKPKPQAVEKQTEVASLPGVDVGGLAGNSSGEDDNSSSTVRTVTKPARAAANGGGAPAGVARVTMAVNLRTSPKKGSGIVMVVPHGSAVNVQSCDGWCQVVYNGKKGWIYKTFLTGSKPVSQPKQQKAASSVPASQQKAAASTPTSQPAVPATRKIQSSRL